MPRVINLGKPMSSQPFGRAKRPPRNALFPLGKQSTLRARGAEGVRGGGADEAWHGIDAGQWDAEMALVCFENRVAQFQVIRGSAAGLETADREAADDASNAVPWSVYRRLAKADAGAGGCPFVRGSHPRAQFRVLSRRHPDV